MENKKILHYEIGGIFIEKLKLIIDNIISMQINKKAILIYRYKYNIYNPFIFAYILL